MRAGLRQSVHLKFEGDLIWRQPELERLVNQRSREIQQVKPWPKELLAQGKQ